MDDPKDVAEAMQSLLEHPGWAHVVRRVREEWSRKTQDGVDAALTVEADADALSQLRQVRASGRAVEWLLRLPNEELLRARRMLATPTPDEHRQARRPAVAMTAARRP